MRSLCDLCGHFVTLGYFVVILWSFCCHFVVTLCSHYGHSVVTSWSRCGHLLSLLTNRVWLTDTHVRLSYLRLDSTRWYPNETKLRIFKIGSTSYAPITRCDLFTANRQLGRRFGQVGLAIRLTINRPV